MAQFVRVGVLCFVLYFSICQASIDSNFVKFDELAQFALKIFNAKPNPLYLYTSAQVIDGYQLSNTDSSYHVRVDFSVECNSKLVSESECFPKNLICDVTIVEDPRNGERMLVDEDTKCNLPPQQDHVEEPSTEITGPVSMEKQEADMKAMFDDLGPFLLKHMNPISETTSAPVEEDPSDVDDRMIRGEEAPLEEQIVQEPIVEAPVIKKQDYCAGCLININTDLPALQGFTEDALRIIDQSTDNLYKHNVVRITKAQKQVVSGVKYILTLEIAETYCLKTSGQDRETCESNSEDSRTCVVEFLEKPWLNSREVISNNCTRDKNDLENEIESHFVHKPESDRQDIIDYLDSMDAPIIDNGESPHDKTELEVEAENMPQVTEPEKEKGFAEVVKVESNESSPVEGDKVTSNDEVEVKKEQDSSDESSEESEEYPKVTGDFVSGVFRKKREVLGGNRLGALKDITESEKKFVHNLAELAVHTLDEIDADDSRRVVLEIVDAKKQLVDGVMYHLKLRVGSTSCSENGAAKAGCLEDYIANPKICTIHMHRSFAADSPNDVKVVKSECSNESNGRHHRLSRRSTPDRPLAGGYSPVAVDDPYIQNIASFALAELDKQSNSLYRHSLVRVVEAKKQVVAGLNVQLTLELGDSGCRKGGEHDEQCRPTDKNADTVLCHVTVWDRPWLKLRQVTKSSCGNSSTRTKRSFGGVGGISPASVDDPVIRAMAKFSMAHLNGISNALHAQKLVRIHSATQQVVEGAKYVITMETGYTTCRKEQGVDVDACEIKEGSNNQVCVVTVWDRPWLNKTEVVSATCTAKDAAPVVKRSVPRNLGGGTHDIHVGMFRDFMAKHSKVYATTEEMKRRFHIFRANMKKVEALRQTEQGTAKYGATRFADLTSKEFKKMYLGLNPKLRKEDSVQLPQAQIPQITLPPEYDWRNYNVVTPVKNQGMCGSCWAFSVTGNIEGQWALRRGELLSLSEQELVDCDKLDGGCEGGLPENAYKAITAIGGLETEKDYPYDGADETCHFNKTEVKATVVGGLNITTNETEMAQWLVKNGPISIGINANAMQFYFGGVSHPWKMLCDPKNLDHGVLIVGYGVHNYPLFKKTLPFWIVKNSWGEKWGEQGYYRVYRGDGTCGINQMATSAVVG